MVKRVAESKPDRMKRGSFPPYLGLSDGFDLARAIYEQGGGQASYDLMSRLTGNSSSSSNLIKKIGALKLYGLVSEQNETLSLTDQGSAIAAPISEDSDRQAKKASLLNVPTFARLFERHKGKLLPADEFLRNILEQDLGVPRELSADWLKAFKEGAAAAGLLLARTDGKIQVLEASFLGAERQAARTEFTESLVPPQAVTAMGGEPVPRGNSSSGATAAQPIGASGHNTRFELSDGRVAEFSIPFGINARDAKRLKGFLKGLEFIIDSAITGEEPPPS